MEDLPMIYVRMTSQGPQVCGGSDNPVVKDDAAAGEGRLLVDVNRGALPISTGVPILPTQSAHITSRPRGACDCKRFRISSAGTAGGASDWVVNDIKIGGVSQFLKPGNISGGMFSTKADLHALDALDVLVRLASVQPEMAVDVIVTYIGLNESGCPFFGALVCDD